MKDKLFYLIFFVLVLGISRIIPHPPNFTPILASAIMAPMLIKDKYYGLAIPILAMFIGDITINNEKLNLAMWRNVSYGKESFSVQATKVTDEWKMGTLYQMGQRNRRMDL